MSGQFPPKYSIHKENFAVSAQISFLKIMPVKKFFGLVNGHAALQYAEIPDSAYSYASANVTYVTVAFIDSHEGKKLFAEYLLALKSVIHKYKVIANAELLSTLLSCDVEICVADKTASEGYRVISCFEGTHSFMTSLENTIAILRRTPHSKVPIVLCDEREDSDEEREDGEEEGQYLSCGEYMAIDGEVVKIHFNDFNDDDFEVVHQVELNKSALADALQRVHTQLTKQLEQICKAVNIDYKTASQLLNEHYKS